MHRIDCPWCGTRDEAEFQYQGDATVKRPRPDAGEEAFFKYVYVRDNPKGWHTEWWHHVAGCRQWVKVVRNTMTHKIHSTGDPQSKLGPPREKQKVRAKAGGRK